MLAPDFPKTSKEGPDKSYVSAAPWRDFDWRGAITFAASITLLFMMSDFGKKEVPWSHPIAISVTVAGIVSILAFLLTEGFWAKKPLIPLRLLRTNGTGAFCVVQVLLLAARFSVSNAVDSTIPNINSNQRNRRFRRLRLTLSALKEPAMLLPERTLYLLL